MVLGYAMEADVFWFLLTGDSLNEEAAGQAVSRMEKERHMREEDAAFVVRCIVEVHGGVFEGNRKNEARDHSDSAQEKNAGGKPAAVVLSQEKRKSVSFAGSTNVEPAENFEYTVYKRYVEICYPALLRYMEENGTIDKEIVCL